MILIYLFHAYTHSRLDNIKYLTNPQMIWNSLKSYNWIIPKIVIIVWAGFPYSQLSLGLKEIFPSKNFQDNLLTLLSWKHTPKITSNFVWINASWRTPPPFLRAAAGEAILEFIDRILPFFFSFKFLMGLVFPF